jgi:hypothetical protein
MITRPRTVVYSSGDVAQAMRRGAAGTMESFVCWSAVGGEWMMAALTSERALVNEEGKLDYIYCEVGYVKSAVRISSIHSARRFAR